MERIADTWSDLGRRGQVLAGAGLISVVAFLLVVFLVLPGGGEPPPVDGSTTSVDTALSSERAVEPPPGTIVASDAPTVVDAPGPAGSGIAPLTSSTGGGGDAVGPTGTTEGRILERIAGETWEDVPSRKPYEPPKVSAAVAAAGRDIIRVASAYRACVAKGGDVRPCMRSLVDGVYTPSELHQDGRGITLAKRASDGTVVSYTELEDGSICYALASVRGCDAWGARDV